MPTYICPRCNFSTKLIANFRRHLMRKYTCEPVYEDVPISYIANSYDIKLSSTEKRNSIKKGIIKKYQSSSYSKSYSNSQTNNRCKYCNKSFSTANNCYRHQKHYCKLKTNDNVKLFTQDEIDKIKLEAEKQAEKKAEEKTNALADKKAQEIVLSVIHKLVPNQNNCNNTQNNTQNNNTQINNNHQKVKINNYGEENINYITDDHYKILFVDPRNSVIQHIKDTHYHILHPENYNVRITNKKSQHMQIYKDDNWETVNKYTTVCSMLQKHTNVVDNAYERLKPELNDKIKNKYDAYRESTKNCYFTYRQRVVDAQAVIITGTDNQKKIDYLRKEEVARMAKKQNKSPLQIFIENVPDFLHEI